ncbi:MAG: IS481 family transposase [Candidatus Dormibacteraceae bacterium]
MYGKPRLNQYGRHLIVERVEKGWPVALAAEASGVSRATAYKWVRRYREQGAPGLLDRSSRPHRSPLRVDKAVEAQILRLRQERKLGPHRLAALCGQARSTCYKVLCRHGLQRLDWLDRPTGQLIRRYERKTPGELLHLDIKKLGRIPPGGGHRIHGHKRGSSKGWGYDYLHSAVDDHSRLAYTEILADEKAASCASFLRHAARYFDRHGLSLKSVMTDNGVSYRSKKFHATLAQLNLEHLFTRPYRPQTNGKVERYNRTLIEEWAYSRPYLSNLERSALLPLWLHKYNYHRSHIALGGLPPISRVNNVRGHYT